MNNEAYSYAAHKRLLNRERRAEPFPRSAFIKSTLPQLDKTGHGVSVRAEAVRRMSSQVHWDYKNESLKIQDKEDYQIVVIPSSHRTPKKHNSSPVDVTNEVADILRKETIGKYPVAIYKESDFADDLEKRKMLDRQKVPETTYIIASPITERDYLLIQTTASRLKKRGVKKIVIIAPFLGFAREDKDGILDKDGRVIDTGQMLTLRAALQGLRGLVDFIYTFEPHSSATQAWAAESGIQLAPISLWKFMIGQIIEKEKINRKNLISMGPDIGRNIATKKIADYFNVPVIGLNKHRDPKTRRIWFDKLSKEQRKILLGKDRKGSKDLILYDDEGASLGTSKDVIEELITKYKPKSIRLILAHQRFTDSFVDYKGVYHDGWKKNLNRILELAQQHNVELKIYLSNSREPIGDMEEFGERINQHLINIVPYIFQQIANDVQGINPIKKPNNEKEDVILQSE